MDQFTGILLHMHFMDTDLLRTYGSIYHQPAIVADRHIQLRDLIVLGVVRIEIVFPVKTAVLVDPAIRCQTKCQRIFYHLSVEDRKASGHSGADRTGMGVWRTSELCGASAEDLGSGSQFYMNFQTDDCFILFLHHALSFPCFFSTFA